MATPGSTRRRRSNVRRHAGRQTSNDMSNNHLLVWNVRGLNSRARRTAVCDVVAQQRASVVCLQESKIAAYEASLNNETVGQGFDYSFLPATGVAGGAVVAWRRDLWDASDIGVRRFSVTIRLKPLHSMGEPWWLSSGFRKGFDSLVLLVSWETWKERNRRTFGGAPSSVAQVLQGIQQEGAEWVSAGFRSLAPLFAP